MVDQGRRPGLDLLKLDEEIADARARRATVVAEQARVRGLLLALVGRDPSLPLEVDPLPAGEPRLTTAPAALAGLVARELASAAQRTLRRHAGGGRRPRRAGRAAAVGRAPRRPDGELRPLARRAVRHLGRVGGGDRAALRRRRAARESRRPPAKPNGRRIRPRSRRASIARRSSSRRSPAWTPPARPWWPRRARIAAAAEAARIEQIRYDTGASAVDDLLRARARELSAAGALAQARGDAIAAGARVNAIVEKEVVQ